MRRVFIIFFVMWGFTDVRGAEFIEKRSYTRMVPYARAPLPSHKKSFSTMNLDGPDEDEYNSNPEVLFWVGEKILRYRRVKNGIPLEDAYKIVFDRQGVGPRIFYKGVEPISNEWPRLSFEEGRLNAQHLTQFDFDQDKDISDLQSYPLTYRLHPNTRKFHLNYQYVFYLNRVQEYVVVAIDAMTKEVVEYHPQRFYQSDLSLRANLTDPHPISRQLDVAMGPLVAESVQSGQVTRIPVAEDGHLRVADTPETVNLIFENDQFRMILNQPADLLPDLETYRHLFGFGDLVQMQNRLEQSISLSILTPFVSLWAVTSHLTKLTPTQSWMGGQVPAVVDFRGMDECNAYFSPEVKIDDRIIRPSHLVFYESVSGMCVAAAQKSSIVIHELGHYLDHQTFGITDAASSEGVGDTLAMLYTRSPVIGEGFKLDGPNDFIRDIRVDRSYPADKGRIHFEGQMYASAMWDLVVKWLGSYSEDWVYRTLQEVFIKSLFLTSHQLDMHDAMISILADSNNPKEWNHHQCSVNEVFARHGLAQRNSRCVGRQPKVTINLDTPSDGYFRAGDMISPLVRMAHSQGMLTLSLWSDDQLLSKQTREILLPSEKTDIEETFSIQLPVTVSPDYRYLIRTTYTDGKRFFVTREKGIPVNRKFSRQIAYVAHPKMDIKQGWNEIPLDLGSGGFVEGPLQVKITLNTPDDHERVTIGLGSVSGKQEFFTEHPPSLKAIQGRWFTVPYRFQGEPASDLNRLIIIDDELYPAGVRVDKVDVRGQAFIGT